MAGHKNWTVLQERLDAERPDVAAGRAGRVAAMLEEAVAFQRTLGEIRKARALTQSAVAKRLDVSQAQVCRIETQADLYLSTLARYIEGLGGELELTAVFEGRRYPLKVGDLAGTGETEPLDEPGLLVPEEALAR